MVHPAYSCLPLGVWCKSTSAVFFLLNENALGICQFLLTIAHAGLWVQARRSVPPANRCEEEQKDATLTVSVVRASQLQTSCSSSSCAMCLQDFQQDTELAQLPCLHVFHQEYLDRWLMHQRQCPFRCSQEPRAIQLGRLLVEATPPHEADVSREETAEITAV